MTQDALEKWQIVLGKWNKWHDSIQRATTQIENKYGNVNKIVEEAKFDISAIPEDEVLAFLFKKATGPDIEIFEDLMKRASRFVSKEIGLRPYTKVHNLFRDYWITSAFPIFRLENKLNVMPATMGENPDPNYVTLESKSDKDGRVKNIISWYHDELGHRKVAAFLKNLKEWPISEAQAKSHPGGRPSEDERIVPEAIVCHVFRYKRGLTEGGVGIRFGWKTKRSGDGKSICRKVRKRLALAKTIMAEYGYENITQ